MLWYHGSVILGEVFPVFNRVELGFSAGYEQSNGTFSVLPSLRGNTMEHVCLTSFKSTAKGSFMYCYKNIGIYLAHVPGVLNLTVVEIKAV